MFDLLIDVWSYIALCGLGGLIILSILLKVSKSNGISGLINPDNEMISTKEFWRRTVGFIFLKQRYCSKKYIIPIYNNSFLVGFKRNGENITKYFKKIDFESTTEFQNLLKQNRETAAGFLYRELKYLEIANEQNKDPLESEIRGELIERWQAEAKKYSLVKPSEKWYAENEFITKLSIPQTPLVTYLVKTLNPEKEKISYIEWIKRLFTYKSRGPGKYIYENLYVLKLPLPDGVKKRFITTYFEKRKWKITEEFRKLLNQNKKKEAAGFLYFELKLLEIANERNTDKFQSELRRELINKFQEDARLNISEIEREDLYKQLQR
jgi:hypothetical protein